MNVLFLALCAFVASQAFTVPLAPLGPTWAIWPTLPDLATLVYAGAWLWTLARPRPRPSAGGVSRPTVARPRPSVTRAGEGKGRTGGIVLAFGLVVAGAVASFVLVPWALELAGAPPPAEAAATARHSWGIYYLYRFAQSFAVLFFVSRTPLDARERRILGSLTLAVFAVVVGLIVGTYTKALEPRLWAGHLPPDDDVAGAWGTYLRGEIPGGGAVGYNHGYVAAQVLLLAALALHLRPLPAWGASGVALACIVAAFLSESRAGLASSLLFAATQTGAGTFALLALGASAGVLLLPEHVLHGLAADSERQLTTFRPQDAQNLSGRDGIWLAHVTYLNEWPARWVSGSGLGGAMLQDGNAHMLPLQIVVETGLVGLAAATALAARVLAALAAVERGRRPLFWTTVALLVGATTQDTFYPVPAFGNFLAFYLAAVAIALAPRAPQR